ncbi:winged helix DNA-binding protein [Ciceribacter sp. L1K23]|uniref:winged helix DNA-binding protein n=1 Tax=unclassified Ciceribacter TaxID=2628820 RepID=UPI001ABE422B|nr:MULTISPECIES: winged helix DNA-binding protein [unclassified Ciceribacter]MBO3761812.1 winged helix DNA-binding protein [Ciceribacter sp. L1K22]MBR0558281.1 winged helix DNA-binding protein [Ciceribacter sp. L1K23]
MTEVQQDFGPIVSSGHLASGALPALSEIEFGLIMLNHAFSRWMVRCMAAAGVPDLSPMDILILHNIRSRSKPRTIADIGLILNIEDTHVVTYAIKKLERLKLIRSGKRGKEKIVSMTSAGEEACDRYFQIRETLLVKSVLSTEMSSESLSSIAGRLRALSGHYDQAARSAASM